jgi:F-type H+-transporting ATPase subunit b
MAETIQTLGIDWTKLIAQTVNFAVVLFVLWKFAYRPVLAMLEARRQKVEESMVNAERIKSELARTEAARQDVLDQANTQANKLLEEARAAAAKVQEAETQKAIKAAEEIITKAKEAGAAERAQLLGELRREVGKLVVETTKKVTGKVLTAEDQQRLAEETNRGLAV